MNEPSGTPVQLGVCDDVLPAAGGLPRAICQLPAGHRYAHNDGYGIQWVGRCRSQCPTHPVECAKPPGHDGACFSSDGQYIWSQPSPTIAAVEAKQCGDSPLGSVYRCRKAKGHEGHHGDGCGNKWPPAVPFQNPPTPAARSICGYPFANGGFCGLPDGHDHPYDIVKTSNESPRSPRLAVCAACGLKPGTMLTPNGWAGFTFPIVQGQDADLADAEHQQLCPPCGAKVAKFIAHLSTPMLGDEDLL